jgi:hypothetical protein
MRTVTLALALAFWLSLSAFPQGALAQAPFTIHLQERLNPGDGQPSRVAREITIAVRRDGARVESEVLSPQTPRAYRQRTIRLADFRTIKTWDNMGLKATGSPWPEESRRRFLAGLPTGDSQCLKTLAGQTAAQGYRAGGSGQLLGLRVVELVRDQPHPLRAWHAIDLGCLEVQRKIEFQGELRSSGASELIPLRFVAGEPDPRLFECESLRESAPGDAAVAQMKSVGATAGQIAKTRAGFEEADRSYWLSRDRAGIRPR